MKRILAATDFSPLGNAAVERALRLAARDGAVVRVVHAFPGSGALEALFGGPDALSGQLRAAAEARLEELVGRAAGAGRSADAVVLEGGAADVLSDAALAFGPDLTVIGAHARGAVRQFFLGGTASRLLSRMRGPVLVVRRAEGGDYARVLAAVDLEAESGRVIEAALAVAPGGGITVAHASQSPFDSTLRYRADSAARLEKLAEAAADAARERVAALIASHGAGCPGLEARVVRGHPNPVLFDLATQLDADLIVALRHKGSPVGEAFMGSIARLLAYHAPCDVLLA